MLHTLLAVLSAAVIASEHAAGLPLPGAHETLQQTAAVQRRLTAQVVVDVPAGDAELTVNGHTIPGDGTSREIDTGVLEGGRAHPHTFTVTWKPNTYTTITRTKTVSLRAGEAVRVDLTADDPGDRVRVIYVATPADVAVAMADLAGIREDDVVFEPGCGDARITIAAIRKGARRGICVDIDDERARESQANVEAAGLADRIEVRHGDALDLKDLSDVSAVFLYMGDHFNMLIRPVLWRELQVGSRVVSHRFEMGDWKPDKSVSVASTQGGMYELHLWTITDEIKRRQDNR